MITVRLASPEDAEAVCKVHVESILGLGPSIYAQRVVDGWALGLTPEGHLAAMQTREHMLVGVVEGNIAGFGSVVFDEREIKAVYVHPDFSRQGVGSAILNELESASRAERVPELKLSSTLIAVQFYRRNGYSVGNVFQHRLARSGIDIECVEMYKKFDVG